MNPYQIALATWEARHPQAAAELRAIQTYSPAAEQEPARGESYVQSAVRLEAGKHACILCRNNVGAYEPPNGGGWVRHGLCNDSKKVNDTWKSADLIGIRRVVITPQHVGRTFGQFLSREVKHEGWKAGSATREVAQQRWASLVNAWGGDARIVSGPGGF